jgi:hypothetical protein
VVRLAVSVAKYFDELNFPAVDHNGRIRRSAENNDGGPSGMDAKAKRSGLHATLRAPILKQKDDFEKNFRK